MPKHIYFESEKCRVIQWSDCVVCFEKGGRFVWRTHSAVTLTKQG